MSDFAYLSIVIPVFDEEENVCPLAKEIVSALIGICDYEIIFTVRLFATRFKDIIIIDSKILSFGENHY